MSPVSQTFETANLINGKGHPAETKREPKGPCETRHDWTTEEVLALLTAPLLDLVDQARAVHRRYHAEGEVLSLIHI